MGSSDDSKVFGAACLAGAGVGCVVGWMSGLQYIARLWRDDELEVWSDELWSPAN